MHLSIAHLQRTLLQLSRVDSFFMAQGIQATAMTMGIHEDGYHVTHQAKAHGLVLEWQLGICEDRPELDQELPNPSGGTEKPPWIKARDREDKLSDDGQDGEKKAQEKPMKLPAPASVTINHVILLVQLRLDEAGPPTCRPLIDMAYFPYDQSWTVEQNHLIPADRTRRAISDEKLLAMIFNPKPSDDGALEALLAMARIFNSPHLN